MRLVTPGLFLCLLLGCASPGSQSGIAWQFDLHLGHYDQPSGRVWLVVDGKRHLIADDPIGGYRVLSPSEYEQQQIPRDAELACTAWWAGVGEDMYVRAEQDRLLVFRREYGETVPEIPPYTLFRTIPVRRTSATSRSGI